MSGITPAATFWQSFYPYMSGTQYPLQIDSNSAVMQRLAASFAPSPLPDGGGMYVCIDPGHFANGNTLTEVGAWATGTIMTGSNQLVLTEAVSGFNNGFLIVGAATVPGGSGLIGVSGGIPDGTVVSSSSGLTITMSENAVLSGAVYVKICQFAGPLTAPASGFTRTDRVCINALTGIIEYVAGTAVNTGTASPPAIPAGYLPCCQIFLTSSTTAIESAEIMDERDFSGLGGNTGAVVGDFRNLAIDVTGNATASIAADEIVLKSALGGASITVSGVSLTLNAASTGANGLDTGSLASNTYYYVYAIYNPSTQTVACVATTSISGGGLIYSAGNMPSGYTYSALIGVLLTNSSAHFLTTLQVGREIFYQGLQQIFSSQTNVSALTSQSISAAVPPLAKTVSGNLSEVLVASVTNLLKVAADASGTGVQQGPMNASSTITGISNLQLNFRNLPILTSQTLFWSVGNTGGSTSNLNIGSYTI